MENIFNHFVFMNDCYVFEFQEGNSPRQSLNVTLLGSLALLRFDIYLHKKLNLFTLIQFTGSIYLQDDVWSVQIPRRFCYCRVLGGISFQLHV